MHQSLPNRGHANYRGEGVGGVGLLRRMWNMHPLLPPASREINVEPGNKIRR